MGGTPIGTRWGYRAAERALATWREVCLLRSRRRTFLFFYDMGILTLVHSVVKQDEKYAGVHFALLYETLGILEIFQ